MPLISIEEDFEGEIDAANSRRVFVGKSNSIYDTYEAIKSSPLCPKEGEFDPYDSSKIITGVQVTRRVKDNIHPTWTITVTSAIQTTPFEDPLAIRAAISLASENFETLTCFDAKGKAILNKAGSLMWLPRESARWVFSVKKNVSVIPAWVLNFQNAINSAAVVVNGLVCGERTLMLKNLQASEPQTVQYGLSYIEYTTLSFQLHYRQEGWKVAYPNVGFESLVPNQMILEYERDGNGALTDKLKIDPKTGNPFYRFGTLKKRITVAGVPVTEPQMLDQNGVLIEEPTLDKLIKLEADVYSEQDFNNLPLH